MTRLGIRVPTVLLYGVKRLALDERTTMSLLVQRWIRTGLSDGFGNLFNIEVPTDGRMSECRIQLPADTRQALRVRATELDLSGAHLMRLWMAQGLHDERNGSIPIAD